MADKDSQAFGRRAVLIREDRIVFALVSLTTVILFDEIAADEL